MKFQADLGYPLIKDSMTFLAIGSNTLTEGTATKVCESECTLNNLISFEMEFKILHLPLLCSRTLSLDKWAPFTFLTTYWLMFKSKWAFDYNRWRGCLFSCLFVCLFVCLLCLFVLFVFVLFVFFFIFLVPDSNFLTSIIALQTGPNYVVRTEFVEESGSCCSPDLHLFWLMCTLILHFFPLEIGWVGHCRARWQK